MARTAAAESDTRGAQAAAHSQGAPAADSMIRPMRENSRRGRRAATSGHRAVPVWLLLALLAPAACAAEAERTLARAHAPVARDWRTRIFQLAEALFQSIHMQLSVHLYQGQHERRGANLDGCDTPLNNRMWLKAQFAGFSLPKSAM